MFVSDTVTHQMFLAIICKAVLVFTPHTPCSPRNVIFFMHSPILYLIGLKFPKECSRISSGHFQDQRIFTEESIAFTAVLSPSFRNRIFLTKFRSINKLRRQLRLVQKCRSRLHWIPRIVLLLSVDLDRRCVVRILGLSHSHCHIQPADHANANRSYRWEDWRWLRLVSTFLILLAHEKSSNAIFLVLLAQKNLVAIFF